MSRRHLALVLFLGLLVGCTGPADGDPEAGPSPAASSVTSPIAPSASPIISAATIPDGSGTFRLSDVDDLPYAPSGLVPALPRDIDPPPSAPDVAVAPIRSAVLAMKIEKRVWLLSAHGDWRTLRVHARYSTIRLSPGGTRLSVTAYDDRHGDTLVVHDISTGATRSIAYPRSFPGWDFATMDWVDERSFLLQGRRGGWLVDGGTGDRTRLPFPSGRAFAWDLDPRGAVVELIGGWHRTRAIIDRAQEPPRHVRIPDLGRLDAYGLNRESLVGVGTVDEEAAVVVADRRTMTVRHALVVRDRGGILLRGLSILAVRRDGIALLRMMASPAKGTFRVVAWDPATRSLRRVSATRQTAQVAFARSLIRSVRPVGAPRWDPRKVDQLPIAPPGAVPALPAVVDPPAASPLLTDAPISGAVLAVRRGRTVQLLSTDGAWRSVTLASRHPQVALSPNGRRLLIRKYENSDRVRVWDLGTGGSREIARPNEARGAGSWSWYDHVTLLVERRDGGWLVDTRTGDGTRVPYPSDAAGSWAISSDGAVLESAEWHTRRLLTDWATGAPRKVSMRETGRLSSISADETTVVGTSYDGRPFSVVVADRATLTPRAVLPIHDHDANYSNWGLRVLTLQDDGTVLLRVAAIGRHLDGFRIVAWDPGSGALSVVSTNDIPVEQSVSFAEGLLRRTDP